MKGQYEYNLYLKFILLVTTFNFGDTQRAVQYCLAEIMKATMKSSVLQTY